ncbi:MAG: cadherin-like domain-containing protein [Cyanobacteria bacterium SBC]|nr:cadherin-like domain-containing protein [Cyanobacteria bacterium SBC]
MNVRPDFSELDDFSPLGDRYVNEGLTFSNNAIGLIARNAGGRGNFGAEIDRTLMTYADGDVIEVGLVNSLPNIVSGQLTLSYTSPHISHRIEIRDGNGNLLNTVNLPKTPPNFAGGVDGEFGTFQTQTIDFSGDARSISIGSFANQLGIEDFDLTLNFATANNPPIAINLINPSVPENSPTNTLIGVVSTVDPNVGDTHTYTLLDDASGRFALDGDRVVVADGTLLDFETASSHTIVVQTTDSGGLSLSSSFVVQVEDVDETLPNNAPIDILIDPPLLSLAENSPDNTVIATLDAIDPDNDTPLVFSLIDNGGGRFSINGNQLVVANSALLDFETVPSIGITIRVSDPGGLSFDEAFTVELTNAQDPPIAIDDTVNTDSILGTLGDDTLFYGNLDRLSIPDSTLLANDSDPDNDPLQVVAITSPIVGGSASRDSLLGETTFTPDDTFFSTGSGQFGYTIDDGNGGTASATVTVLDTDPVVQDARAGNDVLVLSGSLAVDLSQTNDPTPNDTLVVLGFENVIGSPENDTLGGDDNPNVLFGEEGDDSLRGGSGIDTLEGGAGDDIFIADEFDTFSGGVGIDTVVIEGTQSNVRVVPDDVEVFVTGDGFDLIAGNVGDETLVSGGGDDTVSGNSGNDVLVGGNGNDFLSGGLGEDIFQFDNPNQGVDTLVDFGETLLGGVVDRIFVSASGFGGGLTPGVLPSNQIAFGSTAFDSDDRFIFDRANGLLFYDSDGSGATPQTLIAVTPGIELLSLFELQQSIVVF